MKLTGKIAERYVSAVERETERTRLYTALIVAQQAHARAKRQLEDAAYALQIAQNNLDDFSDEQQ